MEINQEGLDLIKRFEGCRLSVYLDPIGLATVGWGQRTDLPVGTSITQSEADSMLQEAVAAVAKGVGSLVTKEIDPRPFSALCSLAYNIGLGNLKRSSVLRLVNDGEMEKAADHFLDWDQAGGKVLTGLKTRREAERALFLS